MIADNPETAWELMQRAGAAAYRVIAEHFPQARRIQILCGSGNNAGDGYVLASLLHAETAASGQQIEVLRVGKRPKSGHTASRAYRLAERAGVSITAVSDVQQLAINADLVVDALLGTGMTGELRDVFSAAIRAINAAESRILSLDVPSGMNPDTGNADGAIVQADMTLSFIGAKRGLVTGAGKAATGTLMLDRLGLSEADYNGLSGHAMLRWQEVRARLPRLEADAHKHQFGHLLVIGGDFGMGGAAIMAAQSAMRAGTGLVSLITRPEHVAPTLAGCPEIMAIGMTEQPEDVLASQKVDALVIGPGLGEREWGQRLLRAIADIDVPVLADGSALNLMGAHMGAQRINAPKGLAVITPHAGEAAKLLGCGTARINEDRFQSALALSRQMNAVTVLKGAGSLIAEPDDAGQGSRQDTNHEASSISVCMEGNPGMATAGSGDVLAGMIGGLLAQGRSALDASVCATCLHAAAGDMAARDLGQRSLNATDILARLPELLRPLD